MTDCRYNGIGEKNGLVCGVHCRINFDQGNESEYELTENMATGYIRLLQTSAYVGTSILYGTHSKTEAVPEIWTGY